MEGGSKPAIKMAGGVLEVTVVDWKK